MNNNIAIKVEGISKRYLIGDNKNYPTLRDKLIELPSRIFKGPKKTQEYWALKDVSFEVKKGEVVGIIGRNGAGKSTLLKILARITEPTSGKVTMYGRVASMLEVGTGFNPELTGRENIFLNGAIIGMTKREIISKFEEIVAFAGVEKFLDTPVKHYSSGMYVRLAFAVAAHLDADILLVDEVLAVGDAEFQKKCLGKMSDLANSGRTVIFVSHSVPAVKQLCSNVVWINEGKIKESGATGTILNHYLQISHKSTQAKKLKNELPSNSENLIVNKAYWVNNTGKVINSYEFGDENILRLEITCKNTLKNIGFGIAILNEMGERILTTHQIDDHSLKLINYPKGNFILQVNLGIRGIAPGAYRVIVGAKEKLTNKVLFYSENHVTLRIKDPYEIIDGASGYIWQTGVWKIL